MAAILFPINPATGSFYIAPNNGATYVWDGTKWDVAGQDLNFLATTGSNTWSGSQYVSGSMEISGSLVVDGNLVTITPGPNIIITSGSTGYVISGSGGSGFPYSGSAEITGSLVVSGSTDLSGSLTVNNNLIEFFPGPNITITSGSTGYAISGSAGSSVTVSDVAPLTASATQGNLWWDTTEGNLYMYYEYVSASISTSAWVPATSLAVEAATASFSGTASYALTAETASYAVTSSYSFTSSYSETASYAPVAQQALSASYISGSVILTTDNGVQITGSLVVSGSNTFRNIGPAQFTGSVFVTEDLTVLGDINAINLNVINITSSTEYSSGSTIFGDDVNLDKHEFTGSVEITGSLTLNGQAITPGGGGGGGFPYTGSAEILGNVIVSPVTGSTNKVDFSGSVVAAFNSTSSGFLTLLVGEQLRVTGSGGNTPNYVIAQGFQSTASAAGAKSMGNRTLAIGSFSHAEGFQTTASGSSAFDPANGEIGYSHAEGHTTRALGNYSHAEGRNAYAWGSGSHAEGLNTNVFGNFAHAEGQNNNANGFASHAEGISTQTGNSGSHAEGIKTTSNGLGSHAEGSGSVVSADYGHAEGRGTTVKGIYGHSEGYLTISDGEGNHVEGFATTTYPDAFYSHTEGQGARVTGSSYSHAEGVSTWVIGATGAHAEGNNSTARGNSSHAEGESTRALGQGSHSEGNTTFANGINSHAEGQSTNSNGQGSHAEGLSSVATGSYSHAEGNNTTAVGISSHAEGNITRALGQWSHAEGNQTLTSLSAQSAHAEGLVTFASGASSHTEGERTTTIGAVSHAQGFYSIAFGNYSFASGISSSAVGNGSFSHGFQVTASGENSVAFGRWGASNTDALFTVGTGITSFGRGNGFTIQQIPSQISARVIVTGSLEQINPGIYGGQAQMYTASRLLPGSNFSLTNGPVSPFNLNGIAVAIPAAGNRSLQVGPSFGATPFSGSFTAQSFVNGVQTINRGTLNLNSAGTYNYINSGINMTNLGDTQTVFIADSFSSTGGAWNITAILTNTATGQVHVSVQRL